MKAFKSPAGWLSGIDAQAMGVLIAAAADLSVIVDHQGIVRDFAFQNEALMQEFAGLEFWLGRPWREHVTADSRTKIDEMLRDVRSKAPKNGRQVNYPARQGADIPLLFSTFLVRAGGDYIGFGRDLRAFATLQQRVVDVQQSFERDYAKMRHIETRYRILFQMTPEPVLIVDAGSQKITEANPAAREVLGRGGKVIGLHLADILAPECAPVMNAMLADARAAGRADDVPLKLAGGSVEMNASAFLFRQGAMQLLLLRLGTRLGRPEAGDQAAPLLSQSKEKMLRLVERVPDGFVVTDHDGKIIAANQAFLEMSQLRNEAQAHGQSLGKWLGRPGVDLGVLLNNLRQNGQIRLFSTQLHDEFGAESDVEISAGTLVNGGDPSYGFAIRAISRRISPQVAAPRAFPKSLEQIIELIGRVTLKDLVREATDVIERLSIEAALTMTGDNRASAAEVLGVSRQSLYVKMRRHGLAENDVIGLE